MRSGTTGKQLVMMVDATEGAEDYPGNGSFFGAAAGGMPNEELLGGNDDVIGQMRIHDHVMEQQQLHQPVVRCADILIVLVGSRHWTVD